MTKPLQCPEDIGSQLASISEKLSNLIEIRLDHENRLRTLENLASQAQGGWKIILVLVGVSSTAGAAFGWFMAHIPTLK